VTETRRSDARLIDAFQSIGPANEAELPADVRERIWIAVSGSLPPDERREIVDRTATDPAYAEAWRVAHALWVAAEAADGAEAAASPVGVRGSSRKSVPGWFAAAAVVVLTAALGVVLPVNRQPADEYRATPTYAPLSRLPANAVLPRNDVRLRWTPGPDGTRYLVRVTTEDLDVVATASDVSEPELRLEPALLAGRPANAVVLWQVEASLPTGERVTSQTFVIRIR
jgi:hypothetical protein